MQHTILPFIHIKKKVCPRTEKNPLDLWWPLNAKQLTSPFISSACKQWLMLNKARPDLLYKNMELDWYDLCSHVQKWTTTPVYDFTDSKEVIFLYSNYGVFNVIEQPKKKQKGYNNICRGSKWNVLLECCDFT